MSVETPRTWLRQINTSHTPYILRTDEGQPVGSNPQGTGRNPQEYATAMQDPIPTEGLRPPIAGCSFSEPVGLWCVVLFKEMINI